MNLRQRCAKAAACSRAAASAEEPGSGGSHLSLPASLFVIVRFEVDKGRVAVIFLSRGWGIARRRSNAMRACVFPYP